MNDFTTTSLNGLMNSIREVIEGDYSRERKTEMLEYIGKMYMSIIPLIIADNEVKTKTEGRK